MMNSDVIFRPMQEHDLDQVYEVEQSADHPWQRAHLADSLKSGYFCEVAILDDQAVGHCIMMISTNEANILILTINKKFHRQGIGRSLLRHMIQKAVELDCNTVLLEVRRSNNKAFNLYLNEGFSEIGIRKNYYPLRNKREDATVMAMDIETLLTFY